MTEKALAEIVDEARNRWPLGRVTVIHRIGELWPGDEIVFVGVTSAHRSSAFEAGSLLWIISNPRTVLEARSHAGRRPLG